MPHSIESCQDRDNHCYSHNEDESLPALGYYRLCFECMHVFVSAADLLADFNAEISRMNRDSPDIEPMPLETDAANIHHCPHCVHDF